MNQVFAITENFVVSPNEQITINLILQKNQKVFFQIFVKGGENNDIRLKIIDSGNSFAYFDGIVRADIPHTEFASTIFPAYRSEIINPDNNDKNLSFSFDNSLSNSNKHVDFSYTILTESNSNSIENYLTSWISSFIIITMVVATVVLVIVTVIKKIKKNNNR